MKNSTSKIFVALSGLIMLFLSANASHFMGVDMSYECLDPCTYRVYHSAYYDCTGGATTPLPGPPAQPTVNITGLPAGCNTVPIAVTPTWIFQSYTEVTPVCPTSLALTGCNNGVNPIINGVLEGVYYRDYSICTGGSVPCTSFQLAWSSCCRNYAITSGASGDGIYSGTTFINPAITPCNNSPTFLEPPTPYICAGQPFTFNQGAFDPDGDSLVYILTNCNSNATQSVGYNLGYSPTQPLGSSWDVQLDSLTGDLTFTPNPTGQAVVAVLCILVEEYRNGVLIGSVTRDIQITVLTNCTSSNPTTPGITGATINNLNTTPLSFNEIDGCKDAELCFTIPTVNPDPSNLLTVTWDQSIPNATFYDFNNPSMEDSLVGIQPEIGFCWTPPSAGIFTFLVTIKDDNCPLQGLNQFTVILYIKDGLTGIDADVTWLGCNEAEFTALLAPGTSSNITYAWTGTGNLNLNPGINDSAFNHLYPAPGIYPYQLIASDSVGCTATETGFIDIPLGATAIAGTDIALCSEYSTVLGAPDIPGQTYLWTPATGLSSATAGNPTFSLVNNGPTPIAIDFILEANNGACVTYDYVSVEVYPTPSVSVAPINANICLNDSITLTASGGTTYLWSNGATSSSITVAPTSTATYSVVAFDNGCSSPPILRTVTVTEGAPGQISGDFQVCAGESTVLIGSGADSYLWNGSTTPSVVPTFNVTNIFNDTTIYMIPLTAGCPGDTVFATITTLDKPVGSFSLNTVCAGTETSFQDASTVGSGAIVLREWLFDDPASGAANTSTHTSPTHTFSQAGIYDVRLIVTSENGCQDTVTQNVEVKPVPDVDFTFSNVCEGLPNVFVDASTIAAGGNIVSYEWDFGDNSTQGLGPNVSHVYDTYGYYNVTLTLTTDNGCVNSYTQTVFSHPTPTAEYEVLSNCQDSVVLASTSSSVSGDLDHITLHEWDFGDPGSGAANTATGRNPFHTYSAPGFYSITLTVTTANGCTDVFQREVQVFPRPEAEFAYDNTCANEYTLFTNLSQTFGGSSITIHNWDFGDGFTGSYANARHKYEVMGPGTYTVSLAVGTGQGCVDTAFKEIIINSVPKPLFASTRVCLDDTTQFTDLSSINGGNIANWDWDFGDGTGAAFVANPQYRYDDAGTYTATLTAVSDSGCANQRSELIYVDDLPALPDLGQDTVCFSDVAFLTSTAPQDVRVRWYYGLNDENPFQTAYSYVTPPLTYTTTYYVESVSNRNCLSSRVPVNAFVFSAEAVAVIASPETVELPLAVIDFSTVSTVPIVSWLWTFGDGHSSDQPTPAHEYLDPGRYGVSLTATDINGCEIELNQVVEVKKITGVSIPSAFSPNGDGINDSFSVGHYNLSSFNIQIFNRWGQLVFESLDPAFEWNGTNLNGITVPEGVYVYVMKALDFEGKEIEESRTITVIR